MSEGSTDYFRVHIFLLTDGLFESESTYYSLSQQKL